MTGTIITLGLLLLFVVALFVTYYIGMANGIAREQERRSTADASLAAQARKIDGLVATSDGAAVDAGLSKYRVGL